MKRPREAPRARLKDADNKLEVLVYGAHGMYATYWRTEDHNPKVDAWKLAPKHYKTVIGAIRAAYVIEKEQH